MLPKLGWGIESTKTIKHCPYCGTGRIKVKFEGNFSYTRLGKFDVQCENGHGSDVYWPNEDHNKGCTCELHDKEEDV